MKRVRLAAMAALVLIVGACGGDDGFPTTADPEDAPTAEVLDRTEPVASVTPIITQPTEVPAGDPSTGSGDDQVYVVQAGDILSNVASQFGVTVDAIVEANGLTDPNSIFPGQELIIPGG